MQRLPKAKASFRKAANNCNCATALDLGKAKRLFNQGWNSKVAESPLNHQRLLTVAWQLVRVI